MPRRALRKLASPLDLAQHFRELTKDSAALDLASLFTRPAPLEVEIGSGKGLFLLSASGSVPEHNFLGIEIARKYAVHAAAKLAQAGRTNAVMLHGDGVALVCERLAPASVRAFHVYFPDPWWKARHKKRRVMNTPLITAMERVLEPEGRLHFWTDVEEYFHSTLDLIAVETGLAGPYDVPEQPSTGDLDYRTHFERRMRQNELPVYRAEFVKRVRSGGVAGGEA